MEAAVAALTQQIRTLDGQIAALEKRSPEVTRLRTVPGVGPVSAAAYVLTTGFAADAGPEKLRPRGCWEPPQGYPAAYVPAMKVELRIAYAALRFICCSTRSTTVRSTLTRAKYLSLASTTVHGA
jgi:hypothetical protein